MHIHMIIHICLLCLKSCYLMKNVILQHFITLWCYTVLQRTLLYSVHCYASSSRCVVHIHLKRENKLHHTQHASNYNPLISKLLESHFRSLLCSIMGWVTGLSILCCSVIHVHPYQCHRVLRHNILAATCTVWTVPLWKLGQCVSLPIHCTVQCLPC